MDQIDGSIESRQQAVDTGKRLVDRFDAGLQDEVAPQREPDQRRSESSRNSRACSHRDGLAKIFAADLDVVDLGGRRPRIRHPSHAGSSTHDPDAQAKQAPAQADHVVRIGTTCQAMHTKSAAGIGGSQPAGTDSSTRSRSPSGNATWCDEAGSFRHSPPTRIAPGWSARAAPPPTTGAAQIVERRFHRGLGSSRPR